MSAPLRWQGLGCLRNLSLSLPWPNPQQLPTDCINLVHDPDNLPAVSMPPVPAAEPLPRSSSLGLVHAGSSTWDACPSHLQPRQVPICRVVPLTSRRVSICRVVSLTASTPCPGFLSLLIWGVRHDYWGLIWFLSAWGGNTSVSSLLSRKEPDEGVFTLKT